MGLQCHVHSTLGTQTETSVSSGLTKAVHLHFLIIASCDPGFLTDDCVYLAARAQGENKFIESLCQTIVPVEELLWVMNHAGIDCNLKRPFLHFMLWVYMKTTGSNLVESGAADLQHDKSVLFLLLVVVVVVVLLLLLVVVVVVVVVLLLLLLLLFVLLIAFI